MKVRISPDYAKRPGDVLFKIYNDIDVYISIEDWTFLCEKRWFSNEPFKDMVEAEFGLYGARKENTSEGVIQCVHDCITDLKDVMEYDIKDKCNYIIDSNCSTLLTIDDDGDLVVKNDHLIFRQN